MNPPSLRSRHIPPTSSSSSSSSPSSPSTSTNPPPQPPTQKTTPKPQPPTTFPFSILDALRILGGLFLLSSTLSYLITSNSILWNYRPAITRPARIKAWLRGPLHLTPSQLLLHNGTDPEIPILLALNGSIYDVTAGRAIYGPGGSYHFFAGRDATRAFVTGCFEEDLVGDLRGVEEMYLPVEEEEEDGEGGEGVEGGGKKGKGKGKGRDWKLRREREGREARRKVWEVVDGWRKMFDGGKGGKYFWVGTVVGQEWGEKRVLCEKARKGRPRRGEGEKKGEGVGRGKPVGV